MTRTENSLDLRHSLTCRKFFHLGTGDEINQGYGICIQPTTNHILVCCHLSHNVKVFNSKGKFISSFGPKGHQFEDTINSHGYSTVFFDRKDYKADHFVKPTGICTLGSNVLVVDYGNNRVQIFDKKFNYLSEFHTGSFPKWICTMQSNRILVASDMNIILFDIDGNVLREFQPPEPIAGHWNLIHGIRVNSKNEIIVANAGGCGQAKLHIFDKDGNFQRDFVPEFPVGNPTAICIDQHDNVIIADNRLGQISVFAWDGTLVQRLNWSGPVIHDLFIQHGRIIASSDSTIFNIS